VKKHILIVDDDERILESLKRALHRYSDQWSVTYASAAESAWEQLLDATYDAVVADVRMPGLSGMELLERMQQTEKTRGVPVVMLTGLGDRELKGQALELGAMDLLNKPVDSRELVARLRSVLRLKDNLDDLRKANNVLEKKVLRQDIDLAHSRMNVVCRLGMAAEYRDEATGNHVVRVGCYSRVIAAQLGLSPSHQQMLLLAAPLHDIGKIGIPDSILLKDGPLDDEEWVVMQRHCEIGERIIRDRSKTVMPLFAEWQADDAATAQGGSEPSDPVLEMAASIALNHHEWWDGSGYPRKLAGEQIPLESRIVAVADVLDALTSNRPYRSARSAEETLTIMEGTVGTHFDPTIYRAFMESLARIHDIRLKLSDDVDVFPALAEGVAV
jgi:response regulator RpfG family c-di-GMP phosphodiesterase